MTVGSNVPQLLENPYIMDALRTLVQRLATQVFAGNEYRVTLLCLRDETNAVQPYLRWESGQVIELPLTDLRFGPNVPIAGMAAEKPYTVWILELPRFMNQEELVAFYIRELHMDPGSASSLKDGDMFSRRSVLCAGLGSPLRLVVSVDSPLEHAFVREDLSMKHVQALQKELELFGPVIGELLRKRVA